MNNFSINLENLTPEEKEQLFSLVEKSKHPNSKKRWKAGPTEEYWYLLDNGAVEYDCDNNDKDLVSACRYEMGNYFSTKEAAEFARERLLVYQKLKDYALEHNKSEIDWSNPIQNKYCIYLEHSRSEDYTEMYTLCIDTMQRVEYPNTVYFTSRCIAQDAINAVGEKRIKKYIFNIKEED